MKSHENDDSVAGDSSLNIDKNILCLQYKEKDTVCGYVKNIGREGETFEILTLEELRNTSVDMFTTVFIGNQETKVMNGKMVTPRGYHNKKEFSLFLFVQRNR